ncbi:hypothetical protein [Corynebacterium glucuronolyticum]|uniref:hypothetical protein n=1 Tax=Corynebacterium glucuronolyticum TaxID=39791 RepID=UPI00223AD748|nr:hypothetical protein [Corynebacterium glucuronolyticum]MCT1563127.1 hypothetical protein [Corynebacterium glucuronolyticum]
MFVDLNNVHGILHLHTGPKPIGCPWIGMSQAGQVAPVDLGPQALFKGLVGVHGAH